MPRNIEVKARIASVESLLPIVTAVADQGPQQIAQNDILFRCDIGRLKLRVFSRSHAELIYYRRSNQKGPKESLYIRAPTPEPDALREALTGAYGQVGRVQKRRTLFLAGRTRIHLDRVTGLGDFLELEVVLEDHESSEAGILEANALLERLGIEPSQLIEGAYIDLLSA